MTDTQKQLLIERVGKAIHEAKIKECWGWMAKADREPWDKANSAVPNQPWHDIARAQAKAALDACHAEETQEALRAVMAELWWCASQIGFDWKDAGRRSASSVGRAYDQAEALLAKLDGKP